MPTRRRSPGRRQPSPATTSTPHRSIAFLIAALALMLGALAPASASAAGAISGTVIKSTDNTPIAQYNVELWNATQAARLDTECTNGAGVYQFSNVPAGNYFVKFVDNASACATTGYAVQWFPLTGLAKNADPVTVVDGGTRAGTNATLRDEGFISGVVTDAETLGSVGNVAVVVTDTDGIVSGRACTAADGTYTVGGLHPFPYVTQFVADGTCGAVAAYPARYYKRTDVKGSSTLAGASLVDTDYGQNRGGFNVRLSLVKHALTVTTGGTGTGAVTSNLGGIACPGVCTTEQSAGTVVTLTAAAQAGSTFTAWTGACAGSGACTVTLDASKAVGATFTKTVVPETPIPETPKPETPKPEVPKPETPKPETPKPTTPTTPTTPSKTNPGGTTTPAGGGGTSGGGSTGGSGGGGNAKGPKCTIATPSKIKAGKFTVAITCDASAKLTLGGTVTFKRGKKVTTVKLKAVTATAAKRTLTIKLPAKAAGALKAKLKLSGALTLTATGAAGSTTVKKTVARLK